MAVPCPYCQHNLSLKGAKPGRYATSCPKCQRKFHLAIPADADEPAVATPIAAEAARHAEAVAQQGRAGAAGTLPAGTATVEAGVDPAAVLRPAPEPPPTASVVALPVGSSVGGYRILREIGRGGLGMVYLAQKRLAARPVALKVIRPDWSRDAAYLARLAREAYAAAQLEHPHLVALHDLGVDRGQAFVAMDFVDGTSLDRLVRRSPAGRLDPAEAVGYALQAARALEVAHGQGFVHGDLKPENLLVDARGRVTVLDLGLTRSPDVAEVEERETLQPTAASGSHAGVGLTPPLAPTPGATYLAALGNPAYTPPEQVADPVHIDARADIYALGCVLYDLVTGRPPYSGRTAAEVLSRVQADPIMPAAIVQPTVPRALSDLIQAMTARDRAARPRDMGDVIRALEAVATTLGGPLAPTPEQAALIESAARADRDAPAAIWRRRAIPGVIALCVGLALLAILLRRPVAVGAFLGLGLLAALADVVVAGVRRGHPIFDRARALASIMPLNEWLIAAAAVAVGLVALWAFQLLGIAAFLGIVAVGIALCLNLVVDPRVADERRESRAQAAALVESLRRRGLDEGALQRFVAASAGASGGSLFEALFGDDAWRRQARTSAVPARSGLDGITGRVRDAIADWLDAAAQSRRAGAAQATLQEREERGLVAQRVQEMTARRKARRAAEAMVTLAAEIRGTVNTRDEATIPVNRAIPRSIREAALQPEKVLVDREHGLVDDRRARLLELLDRVVGPKPRFLLGAALVVGCLAWMHQNRLLNAEQARVLQDAATRAASAARNLDTDALSTEATAVARRAAEETRRAQAAHDMQPLETSFLPASLARLVSSFGAGAGGLILILSAFVRGPKMAIFALPAATIPVLGPALGLPPIGPLDRSVVPAALGAAVFAAGLLFGRTRR